MSRISSLLLLVMTTPFVVAQEGSDSSALAPWEIALIAGSGTLALLLCAYAACQCRRPKAKTADIETGDKQKKPTPSSAAPKATSATTTDASTSAAPSKPPVPVQASSTKPTLPGKPTPKPALASKPTTKPGISETSSSSTLQKLREQTSSALNKARAMVQRDPDDGKNQEALRVAVAQMAPRRTNNPSLGVFRA